MKKHKPNFLLEKIVGILENLGPGRLLDLGCGDGRTGKRLFDKGFKVEACDMDVQRFEFKDIIPFKEANLNTRLPYVDNSFDYVILMEVIEHVYNPGFVIAEISRILRPGGRLILSTPNILNIASRFRFLFEGSFDFFREPTLDFHKCFPAAIQNLHVIPWRYQELEYLLFNYKLETVAFYSDQNKMSYYPLMVILRPFLYVIGKFKNNQSRKKNGVDFTRMNKILSTPEIFLGKHLILEGLKK